MEYLHKAKELIHEISRRAKPCNKETGFCIGNTAKLDSSGLYFTPIRSTSFMVVCGAIVVNETQAVQLAKLADGKVQYILVDAEKKTPNMPNELSNVERAVREAANKSTVWVYKGNDLSVDAVDGLLTQLTKSTVRGLGGSRIAILGAGNLGSKLALRLVERGASITITRRNQKALDLIVGAVNLIKPPYTRATVTGMTDNEKASKGADLLIGASHGTPVITKRIVNNLAPKAAIVDVGKGCLYPDAMEEAAKLGMEVYRLDITAAFEGMLHRLKAEEVTIGTCLGRRSIAGEIIVSGGLLGKKGEIIVDNIWNPSVIYGMADGRGDFIRNPTSGQKKKVDRLLKAINLHG